MRLSVTLTALVLMLPLVAHAQVSHIENGAPDCVTQGEREICHHYFSGAEIAVPVEFDDLYTDGCKGYRIRMIQPQSVLYAEPATPLEIAPDTCAAAAGATITLPKIRRATAFDLMVEIRGENGDWMKARTVPVKVYPVDLLAPLKTWAEKNDLLIKDEAGVLEDFLAGQNIVFNRNEYGTKRSHKVTLMTGPVVADAGHEGGVIVFREKVYDLPQLRGVDTPNGARIYVEMKLLDQLEDNPLAQQLFMNIFRMGHGMTAEREEYYDER